MDDLVRTRGSRLVVVLLSFEPDAGRDYATFLEGRNIAAARCSRKLTPGFRVAGEGHPNPALYRQWAACIAPAIEPLLQ